MDTQDSSDLQGRLLEHASWPSRGKHPLPALRSQQKPSLSGGRASTCGRWPLSGGSEVFIEKRQRLLDHLGATRPPMTTTTAFRRGSTAGTSPAMRPSKLML